MCRSLYEILDEYKKGIVKLKEFLTTNVDGCTSPGESSGMCLPGT